MANLNVAYSHTLYGNKEKDRRYDINISDKPIPNPHIVVIDSRARHRGNSTSSPEDPNKYTAYLPSEFKDVVAVELVNADVPNSGYTIEETNNRLRYVDSGTIYDITVPVGNYSASGLATALQTAMDATASDLTFIVTAPDLTNLFTITGSAEFSLIFVDGTEPASGPDSTNLQNKYRPYSIGPTLGFRALDLTGSDTYTAQNTYNLRTNKYLILSIDGLDRIESQRSPIKGSFCVLALEDNSSNFNLNSNYGDLDNDAYVKYFPEPLPRLDRFRIRFYDMDGNPYNFHGHDHLLTFKISTMNRTAY